MNKLQELVNHPDYNEKASSFSKLMIATFFVSYVYMVINFGGNPGGWMRVTLFLLGGLFVSGVFIAMPFFLLKQLFPRISFLITIIAIVVSFFVTKGLFLLLLV